MSLDARDRTIASFLAEGYTQAETAYLIGVTPKTVQRAYARDEVKAEVARLEEEQQPKDPEVATLERALLAMKRGQPDWPTRVSAARALVPIREKHAAALAQDPDQRHSAVPKITVYAAPTPPSPEEQPEPEPEPTFHFANGVLVRD